MIRFARVLPFALLGALAGCVPPSRTPPPPPTGDASWHMVAPAGTVRYQLAMGEVSSGATPFQRVTPTYPDDQLAACPPPQDVEAQLIVDQTGRVDEVRITGEAQADAGRRRFIASTRAAALQWQFTPLTIDRWAADADGNSHVVDSETKPFSLDYVFRFECHAGRARVSDLPGST